jgi:hypothetical protein
VTIGGGWKAMPELVNLLDWAKREEINMEKWYLSANGLTRIATKDRRLKNAKPIVVGGFVQLPSIRQSAWAIGRYSA